MGAAASTLNALGSEHRSKRFTKDLILPELLEIINFDAICDANKTVSIDDISKALNLKTDVFLTHNWGKNQENHKLVASVNAGLKKRGLLCWFDDERMEGAIVDKMVEGIDNSRCVSVFITSMYADKIGGNNKNDNCKLEFEYSMRSKSSLLMIPVVMEAEMRNASGWKGQLGMVMGGLLYIDMSDPTQIEAKIDELYNAILAKIKIPLLVLFEKQLASLTVDNPSLVLSSSASLPMIASSVINMGTTPTSVPHQTSTTTTNVLDDPETRARQAWIHFFTTELHFMPKSAHTYASMLIDANVATMDKLQKKLARNGNFLQDSGFDVDDADEVVDKVMGANGGGGGDVMSRQSMANQTKEMQLALVAAEAEKQQVTDMLLKVQRERDAALTLAAQTKAEAEANAARAAALARVRTVQGTCAMTLTGHTDIARCVIQLMDGRICSGSYDKTLKVWDVSSGVGSCVLTLTGHTDAIICIYQLLDGRVVSGSIDNSIKVWDLSLGSCVLTLTGHTFYVYSVIVLPDGRVVSGSADKSIKVWDVSSGSCVLTLTGHTGQVMSVSQLNDGRVVSGSDDNSIKVWDLSLSSCVLTLTGHTDEVRSVCQLNDGRVVSGSADKSIKVWDLSLSSCVLTLTGHTALVQSVSQLNDGRVVSGSDDTSIKVWT